MKKSTALLLTLFVVVTSLLLSVYYWQFCYYMHGSTTFLLISGLGMILFAAVSLISFYLTACSKSWGRVILNALFTIVIFSSVLSEGLAQCNAAFFGMLNGPVISASGDFLKGQMVCGHPAKYEEFRAVKAFTEENGQHYMKVLCPTLRYKTDRVLVPQELVDLLNHGKAYRAAHHE